MPLALDAEPDEFQTGEQASFVDAPPHPMSTPAQEFLQTRIVSNAEVQQEIAEWEPSFKEELASIFDVHSTLRRTSKKPVQDWEAQGIEVELIPSKGVYSRKSGNGRRKTRFVACGNFSGSGNALKVKPETQAESIRLRNEARQAKQSLYAGGQDVLALRTQLRHAGLRSWCAGALDIKTAFLLAPLNLPKQKIVLKPPRILTTNKVVPEDELWEVTGAIYGLQQSPSAWSNFRDQQLQTLEIPHNAEALVLSRTAADSNTWTIQDAESSIRGLLGVYVDDLIATGPPSIVNAVFEALMAKWKTSKPKTSLEEGGFTFCGMQIVSGPDGSLHISQHDYIKDLLQKYPEVEGEVASPVLRGFESQTEEAISIPDVRLAQKIVGEILWISCRTRPDLTYIISR